jgi:diguanylate cyclase
VDCSQITIKSGGNRLRRAGFLANNRCFGGSIQKSGVDKSMNTPFEEPECPLGFAEMAMAWIKALRQPATPQNFEIWYAYAAGRNLPMKNAINEIIARNGTLSEADGDKIYQTYISTSRLAERTDQLGDRTVEEIDKVITTVATAVGDASSYSSNLAEFGQRLNGTADGTSIGAIVKGLVRATKEMERSNKALELRLSASRDKITQLQGSLNAVRRESLTDSLTLLANRKYFDVALNKAVAAATDRRESLSLLMIDIDHFKKFNDHHGHLIGDEVLRLVAGTMKQNIKGQDVSARYGGEEFAIVLPKTSLRSAVALADQIRRAIMSKALVKRSSGQHLGRITVSIGVATLQPGDSPASLIERADNCLYAAKRSGRNRVSNEGDAGPWIDAATKVA